VAGMADVRAADNGVRDAADGDRPAPVRESAQKGQPGVDLGSRRATIRARRAGVRRDDVPEQDLLLEAELDEDAVDDGGCRFCRPVPRELPLGGERNAADAGPAIAGGLPDEEKRRGASRLEVRD
jgi:hypothetical protein